MIRLKKKKKKDEGLMRFLQFVKNKSFGRTAALLEEVDD
jgi:hypothetical protein